MSRMASNDTITRGKTMRTRFLIAGTLTGGITLSLLGWFTAAILPPRYKQFRDERAVVETIRTNTGANGIYTAPQGVFVAVSLRPDLSNRLQNLSSHLAGQFVIEFAIALCLSILLLATTIRSPLRAAGFLGLIGFVAGAEVHFPEWNWEGFPMVHMIAGVGYFAANWCLTGLLLGILRRKLDRTTSPEKFG
jgi:hypothetical protein